MCLLYSGAVNSCVLSSFAIYRGVALEIDKGRLAEATQIPSENQDERPQEEISLIVIHGISLPEGQFGGPHIRELFCNTLDCSRYPGFASLEDVRVSSHLVIDRAGYIEQFVSFLDRAWHAGESSYQGRRNCNDFSIGIELEGSDNVPYTRAQYIKLADVCRLLRETYGVSEVVGHKDVAPGRKTDPGDSFDWDHFRSLI